MIPVSYRFVDDCETPVSAFLKLRDAFEGPAFLLESAEQGRLGRYSFLGFRPRLELRWARRHADRGPRRRAGQRATSPTPTGPSPRSSPGSPVAEPERLPPFAGGAVGFFGYDLVRTVEPLGAPNPDPLGLPDMALMVCELMLAFDHLSHEVTVLGYAFSTSRTRSTPPTTARSGVIDDARERAARPGARSAAATAAARRRAAGPGHVRARGCRGPVGLEHEPRAVRGERRAGSSSTSTPATPSRWSLAAVLGAGAGRGVLDLPRPAHRQPVAVHVLPRVRRLPDRRRLARAAGQGHRPRASRRARSPAPTRAGRTRRRTAAQAEALLDDPKERAEHVMLVDLGRNDLGRVCEYGTVQVDE